MVIEKTSSDYVIVDSGSTITYNGTADITLSIKASDQFSFLVKIIFESSENKDQHRISKHVSENVITLTCHNFDSELGACNADPIPLATVGGKAWYLNLWAYAIKKGSQRYVIHTIYRER